RASGGLQSRSLADRLRLPSACHTERVVNDPLLLDFMRFGRTFRRRAGVLASDVTEGLRILQDVHETAPSEVESAHVLRLFLRPDDLLQLWILLENLRHSVVGERVKLFQSEDWHVLRPLVLFPRLHE